MAEFKTVNYTEVRLNLKSLVDECSTRGTIIFVQSKGRKVAMVPLRLLNELNYLRGAHNKDAVTKGEVVPRKELREIEEELPMMAELPPRVTEETAHSRTAITRSEELAAAFEQPPDDLPDDIAEEIAQLTADISEAGGEQ